MMEHYNHKRAGLGLEVIGDTRFGTIYWAALSIKCGLPAFQAVLEDTDLGIDMAANPIAIDLILNNRQSKDNIVTCASKPPPDMSKRAALGIQKILQRKYGNVHDTAKYTDPKAEMQRRNSALAHLGLAEALHNQFEAYFRA
ncbi:uncharacterized protein HD556DRAFT_1305449 [Suillus plorans]|uniref:Uncharacterized protein n=1 Tax=Suillus plorans TaxID=116603 RepID=A0A9P7AIE7_9AGAM|nr:uncharacterized protein HD556DRAFT_1310904 [Suillus plorans]XP_041158033.1 uncharacterized protein HD556DRAFT_1310032 [Suillus plorans]XP_041163595.1 uncharacterized protein HD556DRAFT_1305449 [Suillus plorans]KAG1790120.1 hypothetical protein HD556DRAFT_1310904 [Suillus plorans]KAG1791148.1 hypothetical protein HD556DRAFT_1310032 [Suillus plorans]KAG1799196.1 hypothetical protein HD556DRAFT_1305449 [Suillus plorans]